MEDKVNVEELETILNSDIDEVVTLCKKACLKPKTDKTGNAYFTRRDVDMLKKIKELYVQSTKVQPKTAKSPSLTQKNNETTEYTNPNKKINFLEKARTRVKNEALVASSGYPMVSLQDKIDRLENNLVAKMSELLSEKMDGFDEIIVELVRAKTENENLRAQVNSLNKQVYILKNELASFNPVAFGIYTKKEIKEP
jgi:hypothetical protein